MTRSSLFRFVLVATIGLLGSFVGSARAVILPDGNVTPDQPWTSSTTGYVGHTADGSLLVDDGDDLLSQNGYLGIASGVTGEVTIRGDGSTWNNTNDLCVGASGMGALVIANGGTVSDKRGMVAAMSGSVGEVTVAGAGSTWSNSGVLYVGRAGGGTLAISDGGKVTNVLGYVGELSGSTGNVTVDGAGSTWSNSSYLSVGRGGDGVMVISGGGKVTNVLGYVGELSGSTGNVTVDGAESTWTNSGDLSIGRSGVGTLAISGGGVVGSSMGRVGELAGSTGNVIVSGLSSKWTTADLSVGYSGVGSLAISDGGTVSNGTARVGELAGSTGQVTVSGVGSTWTSTANLAVGYYGSGTLTVSDGATVSSNEGRVGHYEGSVGQVTVTGAGSKWANSRQLMVLGSLTITDGGTVSNSNGGIGAAMGAPAGNVTVSGVGSTWANTSMSSDTGLLRVGWNSPGTLLITDGGTVTSRGGRVGYGWGGIGNVTISGIGSNWTVPYWESFVVGEINGSSGTLMITDGGTLSTGTVRLGYSSGSDGAVTVNGVGSTWTCDGYLSVGLDGKGMLSITDGGTVTNKAAVSVAAYARSTGEVMVSGAGSTWTSGGNFTVGSSGKGTLDIESGGSISNVTGVIGSAATATGKVTVSGTGSMWTNSGDLAVGRFGNGLLNITDGGCVAVGATTYVGFDPGSTGVVDFTDGTLTTKSLFASPSQLPGIGTINTRGLVSDVELVFDTARGKNQTLTIADQPGQNITVNLDMSNPSNTGDLGAGYLGSGSFVIQDGLGIQSTTGCLGFHSGSTGKATVTGNGSTWASGDDLYVGYYGNGELAVTDGATVSNVECSVGEFSGSTGNVTVSGIGSTWANGGWLSIGKSGYAKVAIADGGTVIATRGCTIGALAGSTGEIMINGESSILTVEPLSFSAGNLYVGSTGDGVMVIAGGGSVRNADGHVGYQFPSTGRVTVRDEGSKWINTGDLYVGYGYEGTGSGTVAIRNGGKVINSLGYVGYRSTALGEVTVCGAGSTWVSSGDLTVGHYGRGNLGIADGGAVTAATFSVNSQSLLAIDVGNNSRLTVGGGTGTITNGGVIRLIAGAGAEAGAGYTPILAGTLAGSGAYQALGGTWDAGARVFTASAVERGVSGVPLSIDLADVQRVLIDDEATGWTVGASFLAKTGSPALEFTATVVDDEALAALEDLLDPGRVVRGAWEFSAAGGYTAGEPAYLSFGLAPGDTRDTVAVWRYDGANWTAFDAWDLNCNGAYVRFTVTGFSGYAVTAVPEPGGLALLMGIVLAALFSRKRKHVER